MQGAKATERILIWPVICITGVFSGILFENRVLSRILPEIQHPAPPAVDGFVESETPTKATIEVSDVPKDRSTAKPQLVIDQRDFDFGERERGEVLQHSYLIRNDGTAPLEIGKITANDETITVKLADSIVQPRQSTRLDVGMRLSLDQAVKRVTIFLNSNDPDNPQLKLSIAGATVSRVAVIPPRLVFENIGPNVPVSKMVDVTTRNGLTFNVTGARTSGKDVEVEVETIEAGKKFRAKVKLQPPLMGTSFRGWVHLLTDHSLDEYAVIAIPVNATMSEPTR